MKRRWYPACLPLADFTVSDALARHGHASLNTKLNRFNKIHVLLPVADMCMSMRLTAIVTMYKPSMRCQYVFVWFGFLCRPIRREHICKEFFE